MKTIQSIKKEQENKHSELFKTVGLFWAFSNEQFLENKTELKDGDKYISIGSGGYLPKSNINTFTNGLKTIKNWYSKEIKENKKLIESTILYELNNFECFYVGDITEAYEQLKENFTKTQVWKVYLKYKNQYNN